MNSVRRSLWVFALVAVALAGCTRDESLQPGEGGAQMAQVEGFVTYRERIMLPPGVELEVQLQDISKPDALATVMVSVLSKPEGAPPYPFSIEYDPALIASGKLYALRATITNAGQLMFTSTEFIDPFQGNPVEVVVQRVPEPVVAERVGLLATNWVLKTLQGEPAAAGNGGQLPDIQFSSGDQSVSGFSGCNRFMGAFQTDAEDEYGSALQFSPLAGTLMACEEGAELERQYLQVLGTVTSYRLDGDTLSLLAGPDVVAVFKSF